jgi:hypothetical protein
MAFLAGLVVAAPFAAAQPSPTRTPEERKIAYQISTLESVLARAVEHSAGLVRDQLQAAIPAQMLLNDNARVRGFPLSGYGMIFDVAVPGLDGTIPWSFRTLQQNDLDVEAAINSLRTWVNKAGDPDLAQALQRLELQVAPVPTPLTDPLTQRPERVDAAARQAPADGFVTTSATRNVDRAAEDPAMNAILQNPDEAYRTEIRNGVMDAMLDHSLPLNLGPDEKLTVVLKSNEDLLLGTASPNARTTQITVSSADLGAFWARQISREEARRRMVVTVF